VKSIGFLALSILLACAPPQTSGNINDPIKVELSKLQIVIAPTRPPRPYPKEAVEKRIEGIVESYLHIGIDGIPISISHISGPQLLREPAAAYWMKCIFKPYILNGQARPVTTKTITPFKLK
jgi:hypothetical protein